MFTDQLAGCHSFIGRKLMADRNKQFDLVGVNFNSFKFFFVHRQLGDAKIRQIIEHSLHYTATVRTVYQDLNIWELLLNSAKTRGRT